MIAELAAINAAIAVIKETCNHGKDIVSAGEHIAAFFDNKQKLEKRVQDKGQSDMQAYLALVEAKEAEAELRSILAFTGHLHDFYEFQKRRREERDREARQKAGAAAKKKQMIKEVIIGAAVVVGALSAIGLLAWTLYWLITTKGRV